MKMKLHWIFWVILAIAVILVAVWLVPRSNNANASECKVDSDCVPSSCCHATSCISSSNAPKCSGIFCTQECVPNTLDCGQGSCACVQGKCGIK